MRHSFKGLPIGPALAGYRTKSIDRINSRRSELHVVSDDELKALARNAHTLPESFAVTAVVAERILGFTMFDVQLRCALADGKIAEMQTGEGKTLSAVPTVVWLARAGKGVHVIILAVCVECMLMLHRDLHLRWIAVSYSCNGIGGCPAGCAACASNGQCGTVGFGE